ncbi:MAG: hypothetical protein KIT73_19485, partial [Burkholderiales bacterium]|nr:hypothetical protein [Burkholderiales bacterium]
MTAAILICVSALGVSAARWSGKLTNCRRFDDDEAGHAGFAAWLRGVRAAPVSLMVDMVDEDYRFETLPHTSGRDRKALVERKLKQLYRSTPYYAATLQTHEKGKRREDRFLYSALTAPETLAPWLAAIEARNLPVRGVYALPTVTAAAARLLKLEQPNLLVVSKHLAGLRQTFLKNGI